MTDLHTAAKLALEALEYIEHNYMSLPAPATQAITALRQALANEALDKMAENARELGLDYEPAQQEPVAVKQMMRWVDSLKTLSDNGIHMKIPSGLSAGTCWELAIELEQFIKSTRPQARDPEQPAQEPVAWAIVGDGEWGEYTYGMQFETIESSNHAYWNLRGYKLHPLYTRPQAREPLADGQLEVSVRYNHGGSEFAASKRWNGAWCLQELDRIVANDIHTIRKQIEQAAHGIGEKK